MFIIYLITRGSAAFLGHMFEMLRNATEPTKTTKIITKTKINKIHEMKIVHN